LQLVDSLVRERCAHLSMQRADYRFSRRDVRNATGWGNTQLKLHLQRLEDMEYLLIHRGGRGQSIVYELLYDGQGQDHQPFLMGLIDVQTLRYDEKKSGVNTTRSGSSRPQVGGKSGPSRAAEKTATPATKGISSDDSDNVPKRTVPVASPKSYCSHSPALVGKGRD
jgi:hypothetical protein